MEMREVSKEQEKHKMAPRPPKSQQRTNICNAQAHKDTNNHPTNQGNKEKQRETRINEQANKHMNKRLKRKHTHTS